MPQEAVGVLDGEITTDDIESLKEVDFETASDDAVAAIVQALDEAPEEVKEEFEAEINVFEGTFDDYTPSGSNVTVEQRRTIVAVTAITMSPIAITAPSRPASSRSASTRRK